MRRIAFILLYSCLGLYIAWDNTVLFPSNLYTPEKQAILIPPNEPSAFDLEFIQASYPEDINIQSRLASENISLVRNDSLLIPFRNLDTKRFFLMTLGPELKVFEEYLSYYANILTDEIVSVEEANLTYLGYYDPVIFALNQPLEEDSLTTSFIEKLSKRTQVVLINFQPAENLSRFEDLSHILQAKDSRPLSQSLAAQTLFGGVSAEGKITLKNREGNTDTLGIQTPIIRLSYGIPEMRGLASDQFAAIDSIALSGIRDSAMPGCQILVAHKGMVVYHKAIGHHTYQKTNPVKKEDLYDIASVTKITATTLAAMRQYEQGNLKLDLPLYKYFTYQLLPEPIRVWDTVSYEDFMISWEASSVPMVIAPEDTLRYQDSLLIVGKWESIGEPKIPSLFQVTSRDLLSHTSGLPPSLSLPNLYTYAGYGKTVQAFRMRSPYFASYNPYINRKVWQTTLQTPVEGAGFRYSDMNLMIIRRLVDSLSNVPFPRYLKENFYQSLGLQYTLFNPKESFKLKEIVPTEFNPKLDTLIHGIVHDPVAAAMGGVAGHAGLFSNANDLAILFQMLLNQGTYGGQEYFQPQTVERFTSRQGNARGLGFDMPPLNRGYIIARSASENSFGHTGFTGTCVWADPEHDVIFVFLSNRVHPNMKNHKLSSLRIRERMHQVVYKALNIPYRSYKRNNNRYPQYFTRLAPEESTVITSVDVIEGR
ncbi:MAG: serine hydrolase [Bacteroidota bacterium]